MEVDIKNLLIFSGSSHKELALEVCEVLGVDLGRLQLGRFPDGEISCQIMENVRGRDTFVFQSISLDPNNYLVEMLVIMDALKRASAKSIVAVLPYFGYSRQDRKDKNRVPITAKLVANLLVRAGATRILTMDLHAAQIQGFFDIPVDNLYARPNLAEAFKKYGIANPVVVTPDIGSIKLAREYANALDAEFAIVDKRRLSPNSVEVVTLIGNVEGKDVLLADDMCTTGGTLISAAKACREKGAKRIFAAVTHGLFIANAAQKIADSPIEKVLMSNTIPPTERFNGVLKFQTVSVGNLFGHAIQCILSKESLLSLYEMPEDQPFINPALS